LLTRALALPRRRSARRLYGSCSKTSRRGQLITTDIPGSPERDHAATTFRTANRLGIHRDGLMKTTSSQETKNGRLSHGGLDLLASLQASAILALRMPARAARRIPQLFRLEPLTGRVRMTLGRLIEGGGTPPSPILEMRPVTSVSPDWYFLGVNPKCAPTAFEDLKRPRSSIAEAPLPIRPRRSCAVVCPQELPAFGTSPSCGRGCRAWCPRNGALANSKFRLTKFLDRHSLAEMRVLPC
jgi:hypothetical protein